MSQEMMLDVFTRRSRVFHDGTVLLNSNYVGLDLLVESTTGRGTDVLETLPNVARCKIYKDPSRKGPGKNKDCC
jgi:hypothetical protein